MQTSFLHNHVMIDSKKQQLQEILTRLLRTFLRLRSCIKGSIVGVLIYKKNTDANLIWHNHVRIDWHIFMSM